MRVELTDRFCERAKAQGQVDYFDAKVPGLALRVGERSKSWTLHVTINGKRKRITLGSYPSISLAAARARALQARTHLAEGLPLIGESDTLRAVCEEYQRREGHRLRTADERQAILERHVYPTIGARPIGEIRRSELVRLLDGIEDGSGPRMADVTLSVVRKIMNWHASRSDDFRSPIVRGMERRLGRARDRILTDDEIRALWAVPSVEVFPRLVKFILLTATRRNEAAHARWSEIKGTEWVIPGDRYKTGVEHLIPLSGAALALIKPSHGADDCQKPTSDFIFTTNRTLPISSFSTSKETFDKACGISDWTIHDLRRTARSLMSRAGINADVAERCLGHVIPGVRGVYDRHGYREEKRLAFEALASLVTRIVHPPAENVVTLRGQR
jgi:integrase